MTEQTIKPVTLNDECVEINSDLDNEITSISNDFLNRYQVKDLNTCKAYAKHEILIENIVFGDGFELTAEIFNSIEDVRAVFTDVKTSKRQTASGIVTELFTKKIMKTDKKTGSETFENVAMVRVISGYGNPSNMNEFEYFRDIYPRGSLDRTQILDSIKATDTARGGLHSANMALHNAETATKPATKTALLKLKGDVVDAQTALHETAAVKNELISASGTDDILKSLNKELLTMLTAKHTANIEMHFVRGQMLNIIFKRRKEVEARAVLANIRNRSTSMRSLMDAALKNR